MNQTAPLIAYQARFVFPIDREPIPDAFVTVQDDRIVAIGDCAPDAIQKDLGNRALLPGLVNAHTHLEFSDTNKPLGEPGIRLPEWIRLVVARRRQQLREANDYAELRRANVAAGLDEAWQSGTVALGEIATLGWPEVPFAKTPIDTTIFLELIGRSSEQSDPLFHQAHEHFMLGREAETKWTAGISPHAPYSIHPELVSKSVQLSMQHGAPLAIHLAESMEELELLSSSSGPFLEMLQDYEAWDPAAVPRGIRPLDYLEMLQPAHRVLVIHGNYLADDELEFLAENEDHMSVVFCPRTHAYFEHGRYPLEQMLHLGVNVALGTDSRASNPNLNLFEEMRFLSQTFPALPIAAVLEMGTIAGARALGIKDRYGTIAPGKLARMICVELPDQEGDPYELLMEADPSQVKPLEREL